ncbi:hypothetical protein [Geopseudomonas aromaticivorans]
MCEFNPWQAQHAIGLAAAEAQRAWLNQAARFLGARLEDDTPAPVIGQCLSLLLSGLLQSASCTEEAYQGAQREALIAEHNLRLLALVDLIHRHERGEAVGAPLLAMLKQWLAD